MSHLKELLDENQFVVTCEVPSPHGAASTTFVDKIKHVTDFCDAINVPDNPRGNPIMDSLACSLLVRKVGAEPIMQISARDRNKIALQSVLFAANSLGIYNILFITGDHPFLGTHPNAKAVYDFDSIEALRIARILMTGIDLAGLELEGSPSFYLGATFNPYAAPFDLQIWRAVKKVEAGAQFFQTQAIYDPQPFKRFMSEIRHLNVHVIAGIIPLWNAEMAEFLNYHVPGIQIPESIIARLKAAGADLSEEAKQAAMHEEGLKIVLETIEEIKRIPGVSGIHIMPIGSEELVPEIVKKSGLYPRPI